MERAHRKDLNAKTASMEHRHFATIARIIRGIPDEDIRYAVARKFAADLRPTNPRFSEDRFLRAALSQENAA